MAATSEHHTPLLHPPGEVVQQTRMPSNELHSHATCIIQVVLVVLLT
jgi:hypothetical protein